MEVSQIITEIDAQIAKLQQARTLLQGGGGSETPASKPGRGRPRKNSVASTPAPAPQKAAAKRNLSPEARKRIADAQKRRWAERRKV